MYLIEQYMIFIVSSMSILAGLCGNIFSIVTAKHLISSLDFKEFYVHLKMSPVLPDVKMQISKLSNKKLYSTAFDTF